ncbi:MFS transporter [Aureimonas sp. AU40]|uniref:MFS transporter n=1 Tax=Aureimonas sp. AU40 TaxID=1637747 RepID=UPI0007858184|nr:MFS transporter [Aureimonas sp. AU40]
MSPALRIGAMGFGLIALCYGFARFAFGLFLPEIDRDLGLGPSLSGVISGGAFAGYCIAIAASAALTERAGPRMVATAAAIVAALGMVGIALAPSPTILAMAVIVAGLSTGLASPPMAAAVAIAVRNDRQDITNTTINAGTSAGVALSGLVALAMSGQWRLAFGLFAFAAVLLAIAAATSLPSAAGRKAAGGFPAITGSLRRLMGATFLAGMASTALWSFGGQLVSQRLGWGPSETGILWSCIGVGGVLGAWSGSLVSRFGLDPVHRTFLALMAASILLIGSSWVTPALALICGVLFGAAYVMLTGVYLLWSVRAVSDRPAVGLMIGFLTFAVGQTAGAPIFGLLMAGPGAGPAVLCFAALAVSAGIIRAGKLCRE